MLFSSLEIGRRFKLYRSKECHCLPFVAPAAVEALGAGAPVDAAARARRADAAVLAPHFAGAVEAAGPAEAVRAGAAAVRHAHAAVGAGRTALHYGRRKILGEERCVILLVSRRNYRGSEKFPHPPEKKGVKSVPLRNCSLSTGREESSERKVHFRLSAALLRLVNFRSGRKESEV